MSPTRHSFPDKLFRSGIAEPALDGLFGKS